MGTSLGKRSGAFEVIASEDFAEAFDAPVVHHVLEAGAFAVSAVAVIAEKLADALGGLHQFIRFDEANRLAEQGVCIR